jgi:hypothetical protein
VGTSRPIVRLASLVIGCALVVGALWFGFLVLYEILSTFVSTTKLDWLQASGFAVLAAATPRRCPPVFPDDAARLKERYGRYGQRIPQTRPGALSS